MCHLKELTHESALLPEDDMYIHSDIYLNFFDRMIPNKTKQSKTKQNKSEEWLPHLYPKCTVTLNNCANQYSFQTQVVLDSAMLSEVGVDFGL